MASSAAIQSPSIVMWVIGLLALSVLVTQPLKALGEPAGNDPTRFAIAQSALGPVVVWCCCWPLAFMNFRAVLGRSRSQRLGIRFAWAFGCVLLLLHTAVAFHLGHGWSHEAAWEHTKQVGGYGDGIYVNYAFALVWLADAVWLCVAFDSYFARPRWLHWAVHGFLAFVVFNAAVVFASWEMRTISTGVFLFVAVLFVLRQRLLIKGMSEEAPSPE